MKLPADLRPEDITIVCDTREQNPLDVSPLRMETGTLTTGDYQIKGVEGFAVVERKSLEDLIQCCGRERERFDREVERLLAFPVRAIVVESSWGAIELGQWREIQPAHVVGSLLGWIARGLPVVLSGTHEQAGKHVAKLLYLAARRRYRECRQLLMHTMEEGATT